MANKTITSAYVDWLISHVYHIGLILIFFLAVVNLRLKQHLRCVSIYSFPLYFSNQLSRRSEKNFTTKKMAKLADAHKADNKWTQQKRTSDCPSVSLTLLTVHARNLNSIRDVCLCCLGPLSTQSIWLDGERFELDLTVFIMVHQLRIPGHRLSRFV